MAVGENYWSFHFPSLVLDAAVRGGVEDFLEVGGHQTEADPSHCVQADAGKVSGVYYHTDNLRLVHDCNFVFDQNLTRPRSSRDSSYIH